MVIGERKRMATQAKKNEAYGMQIRLAGLKRRGASQEQIDALQQKYEALMQTIEKEGR